MPKIEGTEWYTACGIGTNRKRWYGYRMSVKGRSEEDIRSLIQLLKEDGIVCDGGKERVSNLDHTDMPAGTPFIQVSGIQSVRNLEKLIESQETEDGRKIKLSPWRFNIYNRFREGR